MARPRTVGTSVISVREFARRIGVTHRAVQNGIASGRLRRSLRGGKIANEALARKEWEAGAAKVPLPKPGPAPAPAAAAATKPDAPAPGGLRLVDAQTRVTVQRAMALRLANRQKRGLLIPAKVARREAYECARTVRDALLNLPDRLSAELAAESDPDRVHERLDGEIRKALEALAGVLGRGE